MTATVLAPAVGVLFAAGTYMVLRPNLLKAVVGFGLLTNGTTLLLFLSGDLVRGGAPLVPAGRKAVEGVSDPLPQALVLTAIVIAFAVQAFLLALVHRASREAGTLDPSRVEEGVDEASPPAADPSTEGGS